MSVRVVSDEDVRRIVDAAFQDPAELRTVGGISRDTGLSPEYVKEVLDARPDIFMLFSTVAPEGSPIYGLRQKEPGDPNAAWPVMAHQYRDRR